MKHLTMLFMLIASVTSAQDISRLLPDSIDGCVKSDSTKIYAGDELYELIDGGADIFREYGFNRVVVQRYSDVHDNHIDIELYEMKDSSSAYGIFSMVTYTTGERIGDFPGDAYAGDGFLLFWRGRYYASLTASDPSAESRLAGAANEISGRIPSSDEPPLVSMFRQLTANGHPKFKLAYVRGSLGIFNLSKMEFGSDFKFGEGIYLSSPATSGFVFAYDTEYEAGNSRDLLEGHLSKEVHGGSIYLTQDSSLCTFGEKYLKSIRIGKHVVVLVSEKRVELERVSDEMRAVLRAR